MVRAPTTGQMDVNILANGKRINCMAMVSIPGRMAESMKEITLMIKKRDSEFIPGLMVENTKANG